MSKTKKYVLAGLVLLLLLGVFVFDRPQVAAQATKPPQQVQVMNAAGAAPGQNVPVSGNVGITGTPSVNAVQSGSWNVGILGTPVPVTVGNLPAAPVPVRDVDNPARQPFQVQGEGAFAFSTTFSTTVFTVPANKRLVIQFASALVNVPVGQKVRLRVGKLGGGGAAFLVATLQGTFTPIATPADFYTASQPMLLYAEAGDFITVTAIRDSTTGNGAADFWVTGYLIDVP